MMDGRADTRAHTHTDTHAHTPHTTRTHVHARTRTYTHTHAHARTHTHKHAAAAILSMYMEQQGWLVDIVDMGDLCLSMQAPPPGGREFPLSPEEGRASNGVAFCVVLECDIECLLSLFLLPTADSYPARALVSHTAPSLTCLVPPAYPQTSFLSSLPESDTPSCVLPLPRSLPLPLPLPLPLSAEMMDSEDLRLLLSCLKPSAASEVAACVKGS